MSKTNVQFPGEGRRRVVIENIRPSVNGGEFPIKKLPGDRITVFADVYADGHEEVACTVVFRKKGDTKWSEVEMTSLGNDEYFGSFTADTTGAYEYSVTGWVDHFTTWRKGMKKKIDAKVVTEADFQYGAQFARQAAAIAAESDAGTKAGREKDSKQLHDIAEKLSGKTLSAKKKESVCVSGTFLKLAEKYPDKGYAVVYEPSLPLEVDRERAGFSSWYELFPRSAANKKSRHGTFKDVVKLLPYIKDLGFDVLYFPPIHPIGHTNRKGKNNTLNATPEDPGVPWAIGSEAGGHKAIHPELGTLDDFKHLIKEAGRKGMEIALDIAFQCSPDHPWVKDHPEWFVIRPDGSIQFAENPPKKYEDIFPINFESSDWKNLWEELKSVFVYWIKQGVSIFRVDNPHTKSFYFWQWLIKEIRSQYPDTIFLAEAFTRPKRMHRLAKIGYTQSYSYFTWRNDSYQLGEYFNELYNTPAKEYMRANLWPNTPDILHEYLQKGGRPAFLVRFALAATLSSNYGIYGPAFELLENSPMKEGSEEYLNSEKYEIKDWDLSADQSIAPFIRRVNEIRRGHKALQRNENFSVHQTDNPMLFAYSKRDHSGDTILTIVNLDYNHTQSGHVEFSPVNLGDEDILPFQVEELLRDEVYTWEAYWNFVQLDPFDMPVHILRFGYRE